MTKYDDKINVGVSVLAKNNGTTKLGRENSVKDGTLHHNTLKALVEHGLATDKTSAKGVRSFALTAAGKKRAKSL